MKQETIFLSVAANHFSEMRLMAEGAIALYENQATVLCRMARNADNHEAQIAFNDIGAALYELRSHMEELQEALHGAVLKANFVVLHGCFLTFISLVFQGCLS